MSQRLPSQPKQNVTSSQAESWIKKMFHCCTRLLSCSGGAMNPIGGLLDLVVWAESVMSDKIKQLVKTEAGQHLQILLMSDNLEIQDFIFAQKPENWIKLSTFLFPQELQTAKILNWLWLMKPVILDLIKWINISEENSVNLWSVQRNLEVPICCVDTRDGLGASLMWHNKTISESWS